MTDSYFRMHSRSARHPIAWPMVYRVGIELASVNPSLLVVQSESGEIAWGEKQVREALETASAKFAVSRRKHPSLPGFPFIFVTRNATKLDFTLTWDEGAVRLQAVSVIFQEVDIVGPARLSLDEITNVFEKIVENTRSSCGEFGKSPPTTEEWYYEAGRKTDVERVPTSTEWMTYFGPELVERIGAKKLREVPEGEIRDVGGGILLIMQREPFSYENPDHRAKQRMLNEYLDLDGLHILYPRRTDKRARWKPPATGQERARVPLEEARRRAEVMVDVAERLSGERLDFSPGSLARVDQIIEGFRSEKSEMAEISQTLIGFGCYVGEVIINNSGGTWRESDETTLKWALCSPVVRLEDGLVVNPLGKVIKRFENGADDNLLHFYQVLIEGREHQG